MALVVLLRGANVGGHRTFRPSRLAQSLRQFEMVNIGAAGTFIVRRPGSRRELRAALTRALPIAAEIVLCDARELRRLESAQPFGPEPVEPGVVRFVSFLSRRPRLQPTLPIEMPAGGDWLVRVLASTDRLVFGEYRRHMRTIRYLGQLDALFGVPATTRNWTTIGAILRALRDRRPTRE
jgi:uncharacterized protein (DUF1697 family)